MSHSDLYGAAVFADSPLAWYRLDETSGTSAADEMGGTAGAHTSVTVNQSPLLHEPFGKSVLYNGTSSRTSATNLGSFGSNILSGTIEFIAQTSSVAGVKAAVGVVNAAQFYAAVYLNAQGETSSIGSVGFYFRGVNSNVLSGGTATSVAINDGQPHHVAVVVLSSTTFAIYVDGVSKTITYLSQQTPTTENLNFPMMIGARNVRGTADRFFPGTIDEVAFYTSRLSSTRIAAHAAAMRSVPLTATSAGTSTDAGRLTWTPASPPTDLYGPLVLADDPVAWYRMDETSGTSVADSSGGGHTGTNPGSGLVDINKTPLIREPFGRASRYYTAGVTTLDTLDTFGADIKNSTIEFVINTTASASSVETILGVKNAASGNTTELQCTLNGSSTDTFQAGALGLVVNASFSSGTLTASTGNIGINDGVTHHVAWVLTSTTTAACYVDGVAQTVSYGTQQDISATSFLAQPMVIGGRNNVGAVDRWLDGTLDEVAFYNTRLSAGRVQAHSAAAHTVALTATSAGTSTDTGAFGAPIALDATTTGTSTTTGAIVATLAAAATSAGTSTTTAALTATMATAATSAGTSTTTGSVLYTNAALTVTDAGTSTDFGGFAGSAGLLATSAGTSTDTAALRATWALTGSSAGTSTDTGAAGTAYAVTATSAGSSTDTAAFSGTAAALTATSAGTSTDTGALRATLVLSAASTGDSTDFASGMGSVIRLTATSSGVGIDNGSIVKTLIALTANSGGESTTGRGTLTPSATTLPSGTLLPGGTYVVDVRVAWKLSGSSAGVGDPVTGGQYPDETLFPGAGLYPGENPARFDLTVAYRLAAVDAGTSTTSGGFVATQFINAVDAGSSTDTADLGALRPVTATSAGASTDTGTLGTLVGLSATSTGTSTTSTAVLAVARPLTTSDAGSSTTTGTLNATASLTATSAGTSTTVGDVIVAVELDATDNGISFDIGDFAGSAGLIGTTAGASTTTADLGIAYADTATSDGTSSTTADLTATLALSATSAGSSTDTAAFAGASSLTAASAGASTTTGELVATIAVVGATAGDSSTIADLTASIVLTGTSTGSSTDTASTAQSIPLTVTGDLGASTDTATILITAGLAALDAGGSTDTATFATSEIALAAIDDAAGVDAADLTMDYQLSIFDQGASGDIGNLDNSLIATVFSGWFEDGLDVTFAEDDEDAEGVTELAIIE